MQASSRMYRNLVVKRTSKSEGHLIVRRGVKNRLRKWSLRPSFVVQIREQPRLAFRGSLPKRLVVHVVKRDAALLLKRRRRRRDQQRIDTADRPVRRVPIRQEERRGKVVLRCVDGISRHGRRDRRR